MLRSHAGEHNIDPDRIAIMGNSSGGWVSAIAATTSDTQQLDGEPDVGGVSSAVQAAVPFFPPTAFLLMDQQTLEQKETYDLGVPAGHRPRRSLLTRVEPHRLPDPDLPRGDRGSEPISYVNGLEPPIRVFHGTFDPLLPPGQSEALYEAPQGASSEASFTLVDGASARSTTSSAPRASRCGA